MFYDMSVKNVYESSSRYLYTILYNAMLFYPCYDGKVSGCRNLGQIIGRINLNYEKKPGS